MVALNHKVPYAMLGLIGFRAIRLMNLGEEGAMMIICENVCGFATFELRVSTQKLASQ